MFIVTTAEWYRDQPPENNPYAHAVPFYTKDSALRYINDVIRRDWTTTIPVEGAGGLVDNEALLADHRGYHSDPNSIKRSDVYYAESGCEAWAHFDDRAYSLTLEEYP